MHILTKVFVLFASILSVLVAALAVAYGANAGRIESDYRGAVQAQQAAETAFQQQATAHQRRQQDFELRIQSLEDQINDLTSKLRDAEGENATLTIGKRNAEAARDAITGKIAQLSVTAQTLSELSAAYKDEVERLRDSELRWQSDKLDLEARLSDVESQNLVYNQTIRALREQISEFQRITAAGGTLSPNADANAFSLVPQEVPGPTVRGVVQEVQRDTGTGDLIVKISLGESDRVRRNSKLYIVRNGQTYLGDLIVFKTDLQHAFGRVANSSGAVSIRPGDQVSTRLSR